MIIGKVYGELTVTENLRCGKVVCTCSCGDIKEYWSNNIYSGNTTSCGCVWYREVAKKMKHGMCDTSEYKSWSMMKNRCLNDKTPVYKYYGGRGISIYKGWIHSFYSFFEDMGKKPSPSHSLERVDNDGDYCPTNCRWATKEEQANNRRPRNTC